jgi:hypothetical protein
MEKSVTPYLPQINFPDLPAVSSPRDHWADLFDKIKFAILRGMLGVKENQQFSVYLVLPNGALPLVAKLRYDGPFFVLVDLMPIDGKPTAILMHLQNLILRCVIEPVELGIPPRAKIGFE